MMMRTLEAMPGPALVVLLAAALVVGWSACRVYDRVFWSAQRARRTARTAAGDLADGFGRLVKGVLIVCGLLFLLGVAYINTR